MPSSALGPHVVGSRVVVRRLVPGRSGPTGGPAFTDVLGVCTSWGEDDCVVEPDSGPAVVIPLALIVSGKPVPPRPPIRLRVSVREAEGHTGSLWSDVEQVPLGEWLLRSDPHPVGRLLKRANSCLALGDPGMPFEAALTGIRGFYDSRERPAMVQVEADSATEASFTEAGWSLVPRGEAHFQLIGLSGLRRALDRVAQESQGDPDAPRISLEGATAVVELAGARGRATLDGDWLGLHGLHVEPEARRQGLARRVLRELVAWGAEQGALTAWLHVETDNTPALALYERLGFLTHHTMRYLVLGTA